MSLRNVLKRFRSKRPDVEELQSLQRLGIDIQQNLSLLARVDHVAERLEEIKANKERDPMKYIEEVDHLIVTSTMPWFRAADSPAIAKAIQAWSELVGIIKWMWSSLRRGENEETERQLRERFNSFIVKTLYPAAYVMLSLSYRREDIAPQYVNVIRSAGAQQGPAILVPSELEKREES